jgi:hypothetical protein
VFPLTPKVIPFDRSEAQGNNTPLKPPQHRHFDRSEAKWRNLLLYPACSKTTTRSSRLLSFRSERKNLQYFANAVFP